MQSKARGRKRSAGLLAYRRRAGLVEVFLVHPGGPFWRGKDEGAWSIPKGECSDDEAGMDAAAREFREKTGFDVGAGPFIPLGTVRQPGGKLVEAWAVEFDLDERELVSNSFMIEWPPGSGMQRRFPEVDRGAWFSLKDANAKLLKGQLRLLDHFGKAVPA
ncbi:NUDIX domain-containing protein [Hydrocarboniphaga effusa]|jgi:predicted NUDIX family NTP pyrophosphohydrolase|uniref:NUDIX domain-containing protein n=1 Tax=Hydrocarboniphaga effusa TaxID=243629 RepID=UPI0035B2074C